MDIFRHAFFFFNRYRSRIAIGTIIAIAAAVYYTFFHQPRVQERKSANIGSSPNSRRRLELVEIGSLSTNQQAGLKARLLLRIRKQFDISIRIFIPTLRKAIFELIDITQPVKQIKALRAGGGSSSLGSTHVDAESLLWEEVKISSFTMLFVSTYLLCGLTTVLKVQLHVLARAILRGEGPALESLGATPDNADDIVTYAKDSSLLRKLIDGTFRKMFGSGLEQFADLIRKRLELALREWIVKDKMRVEFEDMLNLLNDIRRNLESDFEPLIQTLLFEDESLTSANVDPDSNSSSKTAKTKNVDSRVAKLLRQIRQAEENPLFAIVYRESADAAFRMVVDNLRRFVFLSSDILSPMITPVSTPVKSSGTTNASAAFSPPSSGIAHHTNGHFRSPSAASSTGSIARRAAQTGSSPLPVSPTMPTTKFQPSSSTITKKAPPLASILPQLKSLSARLLPETAEAVNPYDLKSLTSGPLLESFCMTIFDAEDMMRVI